MKLSSVTSQLGLTDAIQYEKCEMANTGDVIVAEVLSLNPNYPYLEGISGELSSLEIGDKIIGAIGSRSALRGFVGYSPKQFEKNKNLYLLNMGGVIGGYIDSAVGLGTPAMVKYLGTAIDHQGIVNINRSTLPHADVIEKKRPIIFVLGTCMNVGKTSNATQLIQSATSEGYKVGAAKIAGVAAIKDLESFKKAGAIDVKSFLDCGFPSTVDITNLSQIVKNIINALAGDLLIIELGDGIMGHYKVDTVLKDKSIMEHSICTVLCAADLAAAYGAKIFLEECGITIDMFSGPVTDNIAGVSYIQENWKINAINGLKYPQKLFEMIQPNK